jgi:uncharacterized protein involved in type VI secretion and phage assembly
MTPPGALPVSAPDEALVPEPAGRWYGVFCALVTDVRDPDGQGRVKVVLPWAGDPGGARYEAWARLATLMGGRERGTWFVPDPDDEVLVAFEAGDPRRPYVVGALWNGADSPPQRMDAGGANERKLIRSRNGIEILLEDSDGRERLSLRTPGGQSVVLEDGPAGVELADSSGNSVKMQPSGIEVSAAAKVAVSAATAEISAGTLTVKAGMAKFGGAVQAETVIANSVVSPSYTPGAGNVK